MKKISLIFAAAALLGLGAAQAQTPEVVEDWLIAGGSGTASGNAWLDAANSGRAITFLANGAPSNLFGEAVVVAASDVSGVNPTFRVLAADDGAFKATINPGVGTGNGTVGLYQAAASTDGVVFGNGFGGEVLIVELGDGGTATPSGRLATLNPGSVTIPTGSARTIEVIGSHAAGTAYIFLGRGNNVVIYKQDAADSDSFTATGAFDATDTSWDANGLRGIGSNVDGTLLALCNGAGSTAITLWSGNPATGVYTKSRDLGQYAIFVKAGGVKIDNTGALLAMAEAGGAQDGWGLATIGADGPSDANILPASGLDGDADNIYDAGATVMDTASFVSAVTMDRATGDVYGMSAGNGTNGGVFKIHATNLNLSVADWAMY